MSASEPISPAEIMRSIIDAQIDAALHAGGVVVGQVTDTQQQSGVISLTPAGQANQELYAPIINARLQIRCQAPTLELAERQGLACYLLLNDMNRTTSHQTSTSQDFLVHLVNVVAGPSTHWDSAETWESLLFISVKIGTEPIA